MISATLFKNIFDNKTHRKLELSDFDTFEELLYGLSNVNRKGKKDAELISPAIYKDNTTRANDNVTAWSSWCAIDVDDFTFEGNLKDELSNRFGDYRYVCYSTASSTHDLPKFRLVFQLTGEVEAVRIKHFWFALNTNLDQLGDRQTKDLSRMYYIPGRYAGAYNFFFTNSGKPIDPDEMMAKVPYAEKTGNSFLDRLPDNMKAQVIQYRKDKMQNTNFSWTGYHDCPFFPKNLVAEYRTISNTGWYHKMYQIMVATAGNAVKNKYPITAQEITNLCRELDVETGNWYKSRPLEKEADRALEYVYKNI